MVSKLFHYLQDHPFVGMITSISSGAIGLSAQKNPRLNSAIGGDHPWIDAFTPYMSFFALAVGVVVGILTLILKFIQIREKIKNRKDKKK